MLAVIAAHSSSVDWSKPLRMRAGMPDLDTRRVCEGAAEEQVRAVAAAYDRAAEPWSTSRTALTGHLRRFLDLLLEVPALPHQGGRAVGGRESRVRLGAGDAPPVRVAQKGQPLADKVVTLAFIATFFAVVVFIPLDVFRLRLMPAPGPLVSFIGLLLFVAGSGIMSVALKENAFAAPVVKYQQERGQLVVDTGVYGVVRHPMY
jgi:hypothetical protein